jgi:hypothetical protein
MKQFWPLKGRADGLVLNLLSSNVQLSSGLAHQLRGLTWFQKV